MENKKLYNSEYKKEKIGALITIPDGLISEKSVSIGKTADNYILNRLTVSMTGTIRSKMIVERDLIYYAPKPSFLDWFFGREKRVVFKLDVKDLLITTPKDKNTVRTYETKLK